MSTAEHSPKTFITHNAYPEEANTQVIPVEKLRAFIERIERLEVEKRGIGDDVKAVYAEVKAARLCPKTIRKIIRLRRMEEGLRQHEDQKEKLYREVLGLG